MGRPWKIQQPDGTWKTNVYALSGALAQASGSREYPVAYTNDHGGRMKTMKTWQNFAANTSTALTTWNYHSTRGWLSSKRYADNTGPDYTYTPAGRLASRTWARGITTTYSHNNAGEVQLIDYSDDTPDVAITRDRAGHETLISSSSGIIALGHNLTNGIATSETWITGPLAGQSLQHGYDALWRRNELLVSNASAGVVHRIRFGHDAASRLQVVSNGAASATYRYVANSPLVAQILFTNNGQPVMTATRIHDFINRLTGLTNSPASAAAQAFNYAYNLANQRVGVTNADQSHWTNVFDPLGQISSSKRFWSDNAPVAGQHFEYLFDDIGNRKQSKEGGDTNGANLRLTGYNINSLNQYPNRSAAGYPTVFGTAHSNATVTVNNEASTRHGEYFWKEFPAANWTAPVWFGITNVGVRKNAGAGSTDVVTTNLGHLLIPKASQVFTHDADGNLTSDGLWLYTWDGENRLIKVESTNSVPEAARRKLELSYDAKDRLVRLKESVWNSGTQSYDLLTDIKLIPDGWQCVAELNGADNAFLRGYAWGLDLSGTPTGAGGVGGLLMMNSAANGSHAYAHDGNGNVSGLVGMTNGQWTANYEYEPFGRVLRATGPMAVENTFQFSTKRTSRVTDLVLYEKRPYIPALGRWAGRDSIEEEGGLNLYGFVSNDPVNHADVLGNYQTDFHFYAIYYLFRAKCYDHDTAEDIAWSSQHVDDSAYTNPLRLGALALYLGNSMAEQRLIANHFYGSLVNSVVVRNNAQLRSHVQTQLDRWADGKQGDTTQTGEWLHTYADSWSHEGYSGAVTRIFVWQNGAGSWTRTIGHLHAPEGGQQPDLPYRNVAKAIEAAKTIYDLIPERGSSIPFRILEPELRNQFSTSGSEHARINAFRSLIRQRFQVGVNYQP